MRLELIRHLWGVEEPLESVLPKFRAEGYVGIERHLPAPDEFDRFKSLLAANDLKLIAMIFTAGDSREPEQAGIGGAVAGSFFTLLVTLALSFPIGVAAALYLEEFAPKNRWTDLIEVNINNLAAVPSIVAQALERNNQNVGGGQLDPLEQGRPPRSRLRLVLVWASFALGFFRSVDLFMLNKPINRILVTGSDLARGPGDENCSLRVRNHCGPNE